MARAAGPRQQALRAQRELLATQAEKPRTGPMDAAEARHEADAIKAAKAHLYERVARFHDREGWRALGYASWSECCRVEFAITPRRGHQLVTEAHVIEAIGAAVNGSGNGAEQGNAFPSVSGRAARDIEPVLADVVEEIKERSEAGEEPAAVVAEVVQKHRQNGRHDPPPADVGGMEESAPNEAEELEAANNRIQGLLSLVEQLQKGDHAHEVVRLHDAYTRLEGRLSQESRTRQEAENQARWAVKRLKEIAAVLAVDDFDDIVPAIQDLRR